MSKFRIEGILGAKTSNDTRKMGKGWGLWPDQNVTAWWLYVNVNLNESQWLLVPPPSDVELPQKTRDQTWDQTRDHVVQLGITRFNSVH